MQIDEGLVLERATFAYGDLWVLRETDLHVPRGGDLLVTGHNGVGKSTFLFLCAGLLPVTTGRVLLNGRAPHLTTPSDLVRHGVRRGVLFDSGGLLSNLSALNNVTLALRYHADLFGLDEQEIERRAREALTELRVAQSDFHALPAHLSLGVRKRVSLARAMVLDPNFVFFDDPDAGLDSPTRALVYEHTRALSRRPAHHHGRRQQQSALDRAHGRGDARALPRLFAAPFQRKPALA